MKSILISLCVAGCLFLAACNDLPQSAATQTPPTAVSTPGAKTIGQPAVATTMPGEAVLYEIVAEGDPTVGTGKTSLAFAWQPSGEGADVPAGLPDEAQVTLKQLGAQRSSALYLVIYGGIQPSSRYAVKITALTMRDGKLQVSYQVEGPPPGQAAAAVMTHPYVIAKVTNPALAPSDVVFVEQKSAR